MASSGGLQDESETFAMVEGASVRASREAGRLTFLIGNRSMFRSKGEFTRLELATARGERLAVLPVRNGRATWDLPATGCGSAMEGVYLLRFTGPGRSLSTSILLP